MKLSERLEAAVERLYEDGMDTSVIADLFRESAELARRVEDAEVGEVVAGRANSYGGFHVEVAHDAGWHSGQRLRLVPEAGQGGARWGPLSDCCRTGRGPPLAHCPSTVAQEEHYLFGNGPAGA